MEEEIWADHESILECGLSLCRPRQSRLENWCVKSAPQLPSLPGRTGRIIAPSLDPETPGTQLGPYQIVSQLGSGQCWFRTTPTSTRTSRSTRPRTGCSSARALLISTHAARLIREGYQTDAGARRSGEGSARRRSSASVEVADLPESVRKTEHRPPDKLGRSSDVWSAPGRSGRPALGRHRPSDRPERRWQEPYARKPHRSRTLVERSPSSIVEDSADVDQKVSKSDTQGSTQTNRPSRYESGSFR